jgi:aminopeptidase N
MFAVLRDDDLDPAYRALMLSTPSQSELAAALADQGHTPDPQAIWQASQSLKQALAHHTQDILPRIYADCQITAPFSPDAEQAGKRALAGAALSLITRFDGGKQAAIQFNNATNMTLQLSALAALLAAGKGQAELAAFETQWHGDRLVMDKWFGLQVMQSDPSQTANIAKKLTQHRDFKWKNPNRFRATLGALSANHAGFHHKDGAAYALLTDWLIKLDAVNPQTTARMCSAFQTWTRYDPARQSLIRAQLERLMATPELSRDTSEMISRILAA